MKQADWPQFCELFTATLVAFKQNDDGGARRNVYWTGLEDIPITIVNEAVKQSWKTCEYFPTIAELRQLADSVHEYALTAQRALPEPETVQGEHHPESEPTFHCYQCRDTGMQYGLMCVPGDRCQMKGCLKIRKWLRDTEGSDDSHKHAYAMRCPCAKTNPVIEARQAEARKFYDDQRAKAKKDRARHQEKD